MSTSRRSGYHPALQLFEELLVPAPSGREWELARLVQEKIEILGFEPVTDAAGNVHARLDGRDPEAPLTCLAAHMDEIGMVVTRVETDGTLRVDRSGGLRPWKLGEGPVEVLGDVETIVGVLSMGSTHTEKSASQAIRWEDCRILTGLDAVALAEAGVRPGTFAVPERSRRGPIVFGDPGDPLAGAWTFDDRAGVVTLLRLLERMKTLDARPAFPIAIAFTVSEEVGGHGAKALVRLLDPEVFIAVDGAPIPPGAPLALDGRPGIWAKDRQAPYDPRLVGELMAAAVRAGTGLQPVVYDSAASDASMSAASLGVPRIACIGHVRENSHGFEVLRVAVLDNLLDTLYQFLVGDKDVRTD
ncbi:MAG TPA: M20/M25/M40 family metallo-hydrolase [Anaerolineales bacterium]|nr:M20/M25/M40 family metallo-hydrolase [Anaerolineales bacterium]